jgi:hypothetical protein
MILAPLSPPIGHTSRSSDRFTSSKPREARPKNRQRALLPTIGILAILLIAVPSFSQSGYSDFRLINQIAPIGLIFACILGFIRLLSTDRLLLVSPMVTLLLASALYFGLGPLLYYYAGDITREFADSFYAVSEASILKTNLINITGLFCLCICYEALHQFFPIRPGPRLIQAPVDHLKRAAIVLGCVGVPIKYLFALPYSFGMLDYTLPGVVFSAANLTNMSLFALCILYFKGHRDWSTITIIFAASEVLSALLTYSKLAIFMAIGPIVLARYVARPQKRVLLGGLVGVAALYIALAPFVIMLRVGAGGLAPHDGTQDRLNNIVQTFHQTGATSDGYTDASLAWFRISYTHLQAWAMDQYDAGRPGNTFELLRYVLIPRFIWPDKPHMTPGAEFNELMSGSRNSSSTPTVLGEAYWNGGWVAVVIISLFIGGILHIFERESLSAVQKLDIRYLPIVFGGLYMGARIDDWFGSIYIGVVGPSILFSAMLFLTVSPPTKIAPN